jgi:hypothetical protein
MALSDAQRRAVIREWLDRERGRNPRGDAAAILWRVCNLLWRDGDPVLPEPLPPGGRDDA